MEVEGEGAGSLEGSDGGGTTREDGLLKKNEGIYCSWQWCLFSCVVVKMGTVGSEHSKGETNCYEKHTSVRNYQENLKQKLNGLTDSKGPLRTCTQGQLVERVSHQSFVAEVEYQVHTFFWFMTAWRRDRGLL